MLLAGQWLVQNTLSVQSVAQRLGYTSQAAFSRAFKRVTGRRAPAGPPALKHRSHGLLVRGTDARGMRGVPFLSLATATNRSSSAAGR
ncbi:helix-turn-helix domain-containing protein [Streptomyces sp. NPDC026294]|uniref:helix-turn-helix domain-containing protein n=1 Tax=Streptomyces sp. NPDC026294 TaxID=3155362 RepID=UPI0034070FB3